MPIIFLYYYFKKNKGKPPPDFAKQNYGGEEMENTSPTLILPLRLKSEGEETKDFSFL